MFAKFITVFLAFATGLLAQNGETFLMFEPGEGVKPKGKHIVLIAGDEEYRSEESCPFLGKVLSQNFGYKCTVLFPIHPDGYIDPNYQKNIPGLDALESADLMVVGTRFRDLPDEQMQHIYNYLVAGKPVIGFRTATHAFKTKSKVGNFDWNHFGKIVLGTGWVSHHGEHKVQGCLGFVEKGNERHPILRGTSDSYVFSMGDVYGVDPGVNPDTATILLRGMVTQTLSRKSPPVAGKQNDPMQPIAWLRDYLVPGGKIGKAFCTTIGLSTDFHGNNQFNEVALFVNAANFLLGEKSVRPGDCRLKKGKYSPTFYSFNSSEYYKKKQLKVSDHALGKFRATGLDNPKKDPRWRESVKQNRIPREKHEQPKAVKSSTAKLDLPLQLSQNESIVVLGNSLAERMLHFGYFESQVQAAFSQENVVFRNLGYPGDTAGLRPRSGNRSQWAFPGAYKFWPQYRRHTGGGHEPSPDEWLTKCKADTIIACFGYNESFAGREGLENFHEEIRAFIRHTKSRAYNGKEAPKLVLVSPVAFEDRSDDYDLPAGGVENANLNLYSKALKEVADAEGVGFVDLFTLTLRIYGERRSKVSHTLNGCHLNDNGYQLIAPILLKEIFGKEAAASEELRTAVNQKNWFWRNDYRMLNGVHVYGRRYAPYGNHNYPEEIQKIREMTALRDQKVWAVAQGNEFEIDDAQTRGLSPVVTNYLGQPNYIAPEKSMEEMQLPDGYQVQLFASEREFPELANPSQIAFDDAGRMWVAVCPSYPHYRPGDQLPNDKLLIFEDTDGDGRADKCTTFADGLHMPFGFSLASHGRVYVAQQPHLVLLEDTDGDERADERTVVVDGFDTHDTHHAASAFMVDPTGGILIGEGRFLHSQVETPYGVQRSIDGGVWRYDLRTWRVEKIVQTNLANPWGFCIDNYGQTIISDASGGDNWHLLPVSLKTSHGRKIGKVQRLTDVRFRPTAGSELLYSRHFPDEMQGDFLLGNTIGFLGVMQQYLEDDGSSFRGGKRQELIRSYDPNMRVSDVEIGPDGSLFFLDWHNALIGHMQHSARDPLRDHARGRIYRISLKDRPTIAPAKIVDASLDELFENLKLPEFRSRYRSRRAIQEFPTKEIVAKAESWANALDQTDPRAGIHLLEALWATSRSGGLSRLLLERAFQHDDFRVRAAAVNVVCLHFLEIDDASELLLNACADEHARVRFEGLVGMSRASYDRDRTHWIQAMNKVLESGVDKWFRPVLYESYEILKREISMLGSDLDTYPALKAFVAKATGKSPAPKPRHLQVAEKLDSKIRASFLRGHEVFHRDAHCATCHQKDGKGLAGVYPPLAGVKWVTGDSDRLIKLTLHGLMGPIKVAGKKYPGHVPMTAFGGMLSDREVADVLTYIRNDWGNKASAISIKDVARVREETSGKQGFFQPSELLESHPMATD